MNLTPQTFGIEIERKFLVIGEIPDLKNGTQIIQAYIFFSDNKEFRVRLFKNGCKISIKINLDEIRREEYQYEIPIEDGRRLIRHGSSRAPIIKVRYICNYRNMEWSIDVFEGDNKGLILAEIELEHPSQELSLPPWVGKEVTYDKRYFNLSLYKNPYKNWK